MKPEAQRIAIAQASSGRLHQEPNRYEQKITILLSPSGKARIWEHEHTDIASFVHNLPDFLNDLNAMHEAEKVLTPAQRSEMRAVLKTQFTPNRDRFTTREQYESVLCHATTAQRAEAFLRTLNLWTS